MNKHLPVVVIALMMLSQLSNAQSKIDLKYVDYEQWMSNLTEYQPKIVVVDFWATWCGSCLERFPHMVEMNNKYQTKGIQFVSMLLEDPEEPEAIERAKLFLSKQNAVFDHFFMTENLMASFKKLDLIGIPAVFIYDSTGQLAHRLTGDNPNNQFTETDIEKILEQLLKI